MILHWSFDPVLVSLGSLSVRWYGLLFVGAFLAGEWILGRLFVRDGVARDAAEKLLYLGLFGTVIGARLVHCLFYDPDYYLAHPVAILKIWEGGLASHGGVMGMLLALVWGWKLAGWPRPFLWLLDRVTLPAALGAVFVRVANFLNSEILGNPTDGSWGVVFERVDALPRHPVQLYEAVGYLLTLLVLWALYRRRRADAPDGLLFGVMMVLVFGVRIAAEFFKTPQAAYEAGQLFTVGQYLSLPFVALGLVFVVRALRRA